GPASARGTRRHQSSRAVPGNGREAFLHWLGCPDSARLVARQRRRHARDADGLRPRRPGEAARDHVLTPGSVRCDLERTQSPGALPLGIKPAASRWGPFVSLTDHSTITLSAFSVTMPD